MSPRSDHYIALRSSLVDRSFHGVDVAISRYGGHASTLQLVIEESQPEVPMVSEDEDNEVSEEAQAAVDVNCVDDNGRSALIIAALCGCAHSTSVLCVAGCDVNVVDSHGFSGSYVLNSTFLFISVISSCC